MATLLFPSFLVLFFFFLHVSGANAHLTRPTSPYSLAGDGATGGLTAKEALIRYWNNKVPTNCTQPEFMLSKLSQLSATDNAIFSSLAASGPAAISANLPNFCSAARLLCLSEQYESFMTNKSISASDCFLNYFLCNGAADHGQEAGSDAEPAEERPATDHWMMEPGRFFRERELQKGHVMPMADIRDKLAPHSFLPRSISGRIPFTAADVRRIFNASEDTAMGRAIDYTVAACAEAPSSGELKRCAASAEDLIDFAVSVLGSDVVVRSTANEEGAGSSVVVGEVKGVNGGKATRSVSCHQAPFPYLVYYCHSTAGVKLYEVEIQAVDSKQTINHGVAICHLDTSQWSPRHAAFLALGSGPGKIEVCHWIFPGDLTWTVAD